MVPGNEDRKVRDGPREKNPGQKVTTAQSLI